MLTFKNAHRLFKGRQEHRHGFEKGIFQGKGHPLDLIHLGRIAKASDRNQLKILTPIQMLQRLLIALAQVKVCNTSKNLLNEISQITNFLHQAKEITEKVYNNIMNLIKL